MDIMKKCIYCSEEEIEPTIHNNKIMYFHCYNCNKSYTAKEAIKYWNSSPAQKVCYRYNHLKEKNKDI